MNSSSALQCREFVNMSDDDTVVLEDSMYAIQIMIFSEIVSLDWSVYKS
jgi:hypothetical protein